MVSEQPSEPTETPPGERTDPPPGAVHRPVLLEEVLHWLAPREGAVLVDGTAGAGGHTRALAERVGTSGHVFGLDRDRDMLDLARRAVEGLPVTLVEAPYSELRGVLARRGIERVDGVVLDLGLSSDQLAWSHRGFSFGTDGPLDMRFDPERGGPTAADLVQTLREEELARIFFEYGEERYSRRIARKLVEVRRSERIETTARLAYLVRGCIPGKWGPIDPATRVFQALRIAVNHELEHLEAALAMLPEVLAPGGRAAIISFHSLEDRRVKRAFRDDPRLQVLTRKPVTASPGELAVNPRARSAKLRAVERCPNQDGLPNTPTNRATSPPRRRPPRR